MGVTGNSSEYSFAFAGSGYILAYLPASGTAGQLTASYTNPTTTAAGIFGGDAVALTLNIAFNNAGFLHGTSTLPFGNLVLTGMDVDPPGTTGDGLSALNGLTVNQFLAIANTCLGGGACTVSLDDIAVITDDLNLAFDGGTLGIPGAPSAFAETYLALPVPSSSSACNGMYAGTFHGNLTISTTQSCEFVGGGIVGSATISGGGTLVLSNASVTGNVTMANGSLVLNNAMVGGNVQINGGTFSIDPSTIAGNLQIQNIPVGSAVNNVCDSTVKGNVQFQNNGTSVEIGSSASCPGNNIGGSLQVQNNSGSTQIYNNTVTGNIQVQANTSQAVIDGNTVGGNLQVLNITAPTQIDNNIVTGNLQVLNDTVSTQVFDNLIKGILQCQSDTDITGGGNEALLKQGQCSSF